MTPLDPTLLSRLKALHEKATPAPWDIEPAAEDHPDHIFIVNIRNAWPALLAHIEAQDMRITALEADAALHQQIVTDKDKRIAEFENIMFEVAKVYDSVTGGMASKPNTRADEIIFLAKDYQSSAPPSRQPLRETPEADRALLFMECSANPLTGKWEGWFCNDCGLLNHNGCGGGKTLTQILPYDSPRGGEGEGV